MQFVYAYPMNAPIVLSQSEKYIVTLPWDERPTNFRNDSTRIAVAEMIRKLRDWEPDAKYAVWFPHQESLEEGIDAELYVIDERTGLNVLTAVNL